MGKCLNVPFGESQVFGQGVVQVEGQYHHSTYLPNQTITWAFPQVASGQSSSLPKSMAFLWEGGWLPGVLRQVWPFPSLASVHELWKQETPRIRNMLLGRAYSYVLATNDAKNER